VKCHTAATDTGTFMVDGLKGQALTSQTGLLINDVEWRSSHSHEAFYLFPDLPTLNYLLMVPKDEYLDFQYLNKRFTPLYQLRFVEVDLKKCATAFPVFPI